MIVSARFNAAVALGRCHAIINERDLKEAGSKMDRWLESATVTRNITVKAEKPS
jgi:hypothetical protein